nr:MAG TPA: hypothetical protein [Bacteriophage sp.]
MLPLLHQNFYPYESLPKLLVGSILNILGRFVDVSDSYIFYL